MDDDPVIAQIAEAVRDYVGSRPRAADTVRGIREWWLPPMMPVPTPDQVERALLRLEAAGILVRESIPGGAELWRPPGAGDETSA